MDCRKICCVLPLSLMLASLLTLSSLAQPPTLNEPTGTDPIGTEPLESEPANPEAAEGQDAPDPSAVNEALIAGIRQQIESIVTQQKSAATRLEDLSAAKLETEQTLQRIKDTGLNEDPPYSIILLDEINDNLKSERERRELLEASILTAREAVETARVELEDHNRELRQLKEQLPENDGRLVVARTRVQLAEEVLSLRRQELAIEEATEQRRKLKTEFEQRRQSLVASHITFTRSELNEQLAEIKVRENELKRRSSRVKSEANYAENRWMQSRQDLDSSPSPDPVLRERVEALKSAQQSTELEGAVINQRLQRLPWIRTSWERRFQLLQGNVSRNDRRDWSDETHQWLETLDRERRARELKLDEVRTSLGNLSGRLENRGELDPQLVRWIEEHQASLNRQITIYNDSLIAIQNAAGVLGNLLLQLEGGPKRTFGEWVADSWITVQRFWNYELTNVEDTSLTVGKIVSTLLFVFFGYFAARLISSWLGSRLPKVGVDEAGAHAIESLSFYILLITFGLGALKYASVPLTVFTFLGGAIAIGVGFGSQNILNNFISGLILLAERPIKAGDLIMVDDTYGNVKSIGARSTVIRTGENLDIIIPNSKFLENNVVNLTRRDDRLRTSINVGVAYGSPLERVIELLEQAAAEHESVHERPKPFVWFNDFGDNALAFQVHFWINARTVVQRKKIESEVRLAIDRLFHEAGVVIAFPQRDLHLDSNRPIEIRMVDPRN
ncbi:mechanosensitive ion channel domain-containing protein [Rhodopirellula sp. MGV]|uniref:mechanosensitive ion channel domain-containing protein n=1 Tax=Rhodopirellula sp. MGV TaxID=2023130 RepID=UPI000B97CA17|nr:mechanosensitive ion channel domain-containing protein [Rhodopirellula sp. MGV]OYP34239.1 mechanosensitive ion channel protein MscS [Rhodopirellula sp. MGV]PNY35016.1 mechanosensitive ion channel protein MscS [Rhodopirellula baltica]